MGDQESSRGDEIGFAVDHLLETAKEILDES